MRVYLVASGKKEVAPIAPSSLTATAVSSSRIDLAWTDNSLDEDGFKIERSLDGVNFTEITTVGAGVTTYASTGLSGDTQYYYRVRAYKGTLNSAYSNIANATTQVAGVERIYEIDTTRTETGSSASNQFKLTYNNLFFDVNFTVDWGDGTSQVVTSGSSVLKTYAVAGVYDVKITGRYSANNTNTTADDAKKYIKIKQWGSGVTPSSRQFGSYRRCSNLVITATDAPVLSDVNRVGMGGAFYDCTSLGTVDLSSWDTSNVNNMSFAFFGANGFNGNTTTWDTSNVTTFQEMFRGCHTFNQNISGWNTGNCTNFSGMFRSSGTTSATKHQFNQPIGSWNTSSAVTMAGMFVNSAFNQPIGTWNVSNVTNFSEMFRGGGSSGITDFNQDISAWNTSSATTMAEMFKDCRNFNQPIGSWNVSNVTSFLAMFMSSTGSSKHRFNQDISAWNTSSATNMSQMFNECRDFNQPIGGWDVSNVTSFSQMFMASGSSNPASFNQDLSSWNVSNGTNFSQMFQNCTTFTSNLSSWNVGKVTNFSNMFSNAVAMGANTSIQSWNVGAGLTGTSTFTMSSFMANTTTATLDLTSYNMIRCNSISSMLSWGASNYNYGVWDIRNVADASLFMQLASTTKLSATNLANMYIGWASLPVRAISISFGTAKYDASGASARAILTAPRAVSVTGAIDPNVNGTYTWTGTRYENANGFFFISVSNQWYLRNSNNNTQATATGTFPTQNTLQPATATGWTGTESGIVVTMTGAGWTITDGGQL